MPEVPKAEGEPNSQGLSEGHAPKPTLKSAFREAVLDSSQLTDLVEGMGDVLAAPGNPTLQFRVAVEFAGGEVATPNVTAKLAAAPDKLLGLGSG